MYLARIGLAGALGLLLGQAEANELVGYWAGHASHAGQSWPVAVHIIAADPAPRVEIDLPALGIFGHASGTVRDEGGEFRFGSFVRDDRLRFAGRRTGDELIGTLEAYGITAEFAAQRNPDVPPHLRREDLSFQNGSTQLAGTLILPEGPGPHPAIVLTHGSGAQGRSTTLYSSLATFFARHGVAALIYDKRGVGKSTGDWQQASLIDLAHDALAGVEALGRRADIAPDRIGCGGASQGGWLAPLCASLSERVAFVVVNSAPGISPAEQNNFNCETDLVAAGVSAEEVEAAVNLRRRADQYFTTGVIDPALNADLRDFRQRHEGASWRDVWIHEPPLLPAGPGTNNAYTTDYMLLDPATIWPRVKVPVLAQWGAEDRLVPAIRSRDIIQSCLDSEGNTQARLVIHPGAGHGLGAVRVSSDFSWPHLAPEYLPQIENWLAEVISK